MIENKSLGSKIFDIVNVVILVLITLICILPVWYVLCVSLSSREAVNAGEVALWPVGFNLLSYQKIMGESDFFGSFLVSIERVILGTGVSMLCILLAAYPLSRTKKQFPQRDIFMWIFVFCMLFNGGTVPWYVTMKNYGLMDSIWGLVLGMGLQVFNVILAVNFFKNLPVELTGKEFDLLVFLAESKGRVFTKKQIYTQVWAEEYAFDDSNIMSFISKLRKKIEPNPEQPFYIQTVRGVGYRFNKEA